LERARLARRQAGATHDENFRKLADGLAELYFQPISEALEIFILKDANSGRAVCAWVRTPESLDLRMEVLENPENELSPRIDSVGRTGVRLQRQGSTAQSPATLLHNVDSTQLVLLPNSNSTWVSGSYSLVFTYQRDYGDEVREIDHRYDRPVEYRSGNSLSEERALEWLL
jgi:hypothetical protein